MLDCADRLWARQIDMPCPYDLEEVTADYCFTLAAVRPAMYCFCTEMNTRMTGMVTSVAAAIDAPSGGSLPAVRPPAMLATPTGRVIASFARSTASGHR